jgi:hypothetical protein
MEIDIRGIDKVKLVKKLYERAKCPGAMALFAYKPGHTLSDEQAEEMAQAPYLDYVYGRVMKTSVAGDWMRVDLYDRDNGRGAAQACVDAVLEEMTAPGTR